jgi:hypothetical protein
MECYICCEEYETGVKGIQCFQCKNTCCGKCYMKMYIKSKDTVKCPLCRFQAHNKPYTGSNFRFMTQTRAVRCGFNLDESWEWANQAV